MRRILLFRQTPNKSVSNKITSTTNKYYDENKMQQCIKSDRDRSILLKIEIIREDLFAKVTFEVRPEC